MFARRVWLWRALHAQMNSETRKIFRRIEQNKKIEMHKSLNGIAISGFLNVPN